MKMTRDTFACRCAAALLLAALAIAWAGWPRVAEAKGTGPTPTSSRERAERATGTDVDEVFSLLEEILEHSVEVVSETIDEVVNATPGHASLGEEVTVTDNLAVSVVSVEEGPYDHADGSPTVMVTVTMHNLSDHVVYVKASNWDADTTDGRRVDHKLFVFDEQGNVVARSFSPTAVSPGATYTGVLYFDGEGLVSVVYEPHWVVSTQDQYVYFDL